MTNLTLYQIVGEFREASQQLAELDIPEEALRDTLESMQCAIEVKSKAVAAQVLNLEAMAEAVDNAAKAMKERAAKIQRRADWIREYLRANMTACGITKIEAVEFVLSIKKNPPAVVIDDETAIPDDYKRIPEPPPPPVAKPDKKLIAQAIKDGFVVPGAHMEQGTRLAIKP